MGNGILQTAGGGHFKGWVNSTATGLGVDVGVSGGEGYVIAYDRSSSVYAPINLQGHTNNRLRISSNGSDFTGNVSVTGTGTATDWVATSDRRLKENVKPVNGQLDKVRAISHYVVNYDRKDTGKNETGFIAQDLAKVAPEYVNVPDDPSEMQSVNYAKMVVPLYKGTAELSEEVERLKKALAKEAERSRKESEEVARLKAQVLEMQQLKREVEELKALLINANRVNQTLYRPLDAQSATE